MNKLLHTPLTVHNVKLANRLVMPPMATGKTPDGTVQDDLLAYYDARSKGGCIDSSSPNTLTSAPRARHTRASSPFHATPYSGHLQA